MITTRALSHLHALVDLTQRADRQLDGLARTLVQVNQQIDAVVDDEDIVVTETLVEEASGGETEFRLSRSPVSAEGFVLMVNGSPVSVDMYELDAAHGTVAPTVDIPQGATITATYTVAGLASQCVELMALMPNLSAAYFLERKDAYEAAIGWIQSRGAP